MITKISPNIDHTVTLSMTCRQTLQEDQNTKLRSVINYYVRLHRTDSEAMEAGKDCVFERGQTMRWRSAADERRTPAEWGVPDL